MIDKLFGTIEDIYFMVVSDTKSETSTVIQIDQETSNLSETLQLFKSKAQNTMYIGKHGDKYTLLKLAVLILNYIMHEDDGVFSNYEKDYLKEYIGKKFVKFNNNEQADLQKAIETRAQIQDITSLVQDYLITLRPIDMLLDKIVLYVKDQPQYHPPLCRILNALIN